MASIKRPPSDPPGGRRKRPPTVINLEATEVPSESSVQPPAGDAPSPQQATESPAPPQAAEAPVPPPEKPAETAFEKASYEQPPPYEPERRSEPEKPRAAGQSQPESPMPPPGLLGSSNPQLMSGAFGAAGGFALFLLLWLFGAFSASPPPAPPDMSPRFAAIEKQLNDLAARPAPASVDPKTITGALDKSMEEIAARLTSLERAVAAPRAPVTDPVVLGRITATENAAKSLADNVAALSRRMDGLDTALREANARDDDRIGKLTATTTDLQARARDTAAGSDRGSRLALSAAALREKVERGDAYLNELAIVKPQLGADFFDVGPLRVVQLGEQRDHGVAVRLLKAIGRFAR